MACKPIYSESLQQNPYLDSWVRFDPESQCAFVYSGKVEFGQGAMTGIAQIAAHELGLRMDQIQIISGNTCQSPDEGITSGSQSIEVGGTAMRIACAAVREIFCDKASKHLQTELTVDVADGAFTVDGTPYSLTYWDIADEIDLHCKVSPNVSLRKPNESGFIGRKVSRIDLPTKLTTGGFIHDLDFPGMLHGRILRAPSHTACLQSLDIHLVESLPGVQSVVRSGNYVAVVADTEETAIAAHKKLEKAAQWREEDTLPSSPEVADWLFELPSEDKTYVISDDETQASRPGRSFGAVYTRPILAHASIGPSCAVALLNESALTIWSHTQSAFLLRDQIAKVLAMPVTSVTVIHTQGAGCYGHNGADDAALDAALLAREHPGTPVRVQWSREDEMSFSPFGSPMGIRIDASTDNNKNVSNWSLQVWSGSHSQRPGYNGSPNLLAARHVEPAWEFAEPKDLLLERGGGGLRNATAIYDFPHHEIVHHFIGSLPFRLSALRSLGAYANVFAIESFMDELADSVDSDPVNFRFNHLSDNRAKAVIEKAASMADWRPDQEQRDSGQAKGLGFARYKSKAAYAAVIAQVKVDDDIVVQRIWCAIDAGLIINPDGLINQIEGGVIQSLSWTLKESVRFDRRHITSRTWDDYPILGFSEIPSIEVHLMHIDSEIPLGVGECVAGPTAAAVANAIARALGLRIRQLPITRDRIMLTASQ